MEVANANLHCLFLVTDITSFAWAVEPILVLKAFICLPALAPSPFFDYYCSEFFSFFLFFYFLLSTGFFLNFSTYKLSRKFSSILSCQTQYVCALFWLCFNTQYSPCLVQTSTVPALTLFSLSSLSVIILPQGYPH